MLEVEHGVGRLDAEEEPVLRRLGESGTLKSGWYGMGRPFSASIPTTAVAAATSTVSSNVTGMNDGQLISSGLPAMLIG